MPADFERSKSLQHDAIAEQKKPLTAIVSTAQNQEPNRKSRNNRIKRKRVEL